MFADSQCVQFDNFPGGALDVYGNDIHADEMHEKSMLDIENG